MYTNYRNHLNYLNRAKFAHMTGDSKSMNLKTRFTPFLNAFGMDGLLALAWFTGSKVDSRKMPFLEIVGPTGSGKTLLVQIMSEYLNDESIVEHDMSNCTRAGLMRMLCNCPPNTPFILETDEDDDLDVLKPCFNGEIARLTAVAGGNKFVRHTFDGALCITSFPHADNQSPATMSRFVRCMVSDEVHFGWDTRALRCLYHDSKILDCYDRVKFAGMAHELYYKDRYDVPHRLAMSYSHVAAWGLLLIEHFELDVKDQFLQHIACTLRDHARRIEDEERRRSTEQTSTRKPRLDPEKIHCPHCQKLNNCSAEFAFLHSDPNEDRQEVICKGSRCGQVFYIKAERTTRIKVVKEVQKDLPF